MEDNGYIRKGNWTISDYFKLNAAMRLSEYSLIMPIWKCNATTISIKTYKGSFKLLTPFYEWINGQTLSWYQDYNIVKHNREQEFKKASLQNLVNAVAGLMAVLYAQFEDHIFKTHDMPSIIDGIDSFISIDDSLFCLKPPIWKDDEIYNLDWVSIKKEKEPYNKYPFKY